MLADKFRWRLDLGLIEIIFQINVRKYRMSLPFIRRYYCDEVNGRMCTTERAFNAVPGRSSLWGQAPAGEMSETKCIMILQ